jgi:hypothetical protein
MEIQAIEAALQRYEAATAELRAALEKHQSSKLAYEKLFEEAEKIQARFTTTGDYVAIQERATPASEHVEDWRLPVLIGAIGGGVPGALVGLLLSLVIARPAGKPAV